MLRGAALILSGLILGTPTGADAGPAAKVTLVKAGRLLDVRVGKYLSDQAVLIEGERIKEVGPIAAVASHAPAGAVVIDLGAATVLPGLIDCHAHLLSSMKGQMNAGENILNTVAGMSPSARALLGAANARETLEAGITSVRNVGHSGVDGDAALRDAIKAGGVPGPRMLAATRKLTPPGGQAVTLRHEVAHAVIDLEFLPVSRPEDGRRAVRRALFSGTDVIKVVMDAGPRVLAYDEIKAIVDEAHRSGLKVAAHATTERGIKAAADAGVDSIEHADEVSDETLEMMRDKNIFLGATDWSAEMIRGLYTKSVYISPEKSAELEAEIKAWVEQTAKRMEKARKAGGRFVMASDMWFRYPGKTRGQAALMILGGLQAEGVPPAEVLRAATVNAAELLGWKDDVGAVEAGKLADLVAEDPLRDEGRRRRPERAPEALRRDRRRPAVPIAANGARRPERLPTAEVTRTLLSVSRAARKRPSGERG